jgi:3-oxoacyl-[acyl-carrier protein] reductase/pteridine reductase
MLTQTMAKAFAPEVSVNCVAPGWITIPEAGTDSDAPEAQFSQAADRGQSARFAAKTPMGRNGSGADVAEAVLFFATGPHFITGQTLAVDGGLGLS